VRVFDQRAGLIRPSLPSRPTRSRCCFRMRRALPIRRRAREARSRREKVVRGGRRQGTIAAARENQAALTEAEVAQARRMVQTPAKFPSQRARRRQGLRAQCSPARLRPAHPNCRSRRAEALLRNTLRLHRPRAERAGDDPPSATPAQILDSLRRAVKTMEVASDAMEVDRARVRVLFKGLALPQCTAPDALPLKAQNPLKKPLRSARQRSPSPFSTTPMPKKCSDYRTHSWKFQSLQPVSIFPTR